jgi:hypothetical protein
MSTFGEMIDSTLLELSGYSVLQDQATHLTGQISSTASAIPIADTSAISRGLVEIGDELIWVDSVNLQASTVTVAPYGRGYRGTTAATHAVGSRVVSAPVFPRSLVKSKINEAIRATFPDLFAIGTTTLSFVPARTTYEMPAGAQEIISVAWQSIGPSREWSPIRRFRVDKQAATSAFPSGVTLSIYDMITPGRTIKVTYTKQPSPMVNDSDDFVTTTGLPASCEDVVRLGVAYRMVPFFDSPHLSGISAEADFGINNRPIGSSSNMGRFMLQMYGVRLQEEARRLRDLFPIRSHYTR